MRHVPGCLSLLALAAPAASQVTPAPAASQTTPAPAAAQTTPAPVAPQVTPAPSATAISASPDFMARAAALADLLTGNGDYEAYFAPDFRAKVSRDKVDVVVAQLLAAGGPFASIERIEPSSPWSGTVIADYRNGSATFRLAVDPDPPHQVTGLFAASFVPREQTLTEVVAAIGNLHGDTGLALARLGSGAPQMIVQRNVDRPFAIGSEFKLVILAELVRATGAGERKWDDRVTLDGTPLPGGGYADKPAGTQVSLGELAMQMISISDNSAADILLRTLGREKVEAMMPAIGIRDPARNRPFLATLEAFKLKGTGGGALADRYLALDEAGRRQMLAGEIAATPTGAIDAELFARGLPLRIDRLEWFASPADMVRIMDWLRRHTEGPGGATARAILSRNAGIAPSAAGKWQYVGYKGGSEPGVLTMTLLLQARNGEWYALSGAWNDVSQALEDGRFTALINAAAKLAVPDAAP